MFCCSLDISVSYAHTRSRTRRMRRAKASVSIASVSRPAADVGEKPTTPSRYPPAWLLSYIKHHTRAIQKGYVKAHNKVTVKGLRTVHSFMNSKVVGPCLTVIGPASTVGRGCGLAWQRGCAQNHGAMRRSKVLGRGRRQGRGSLRDLFWPRLRDLSENWRTTHRPLAHFTKQNDVGKSMFPVPLFAFASPAGLWRTTDNWAATSRVEEHRGCRRAKLY